ncbi:MAG TPA: hypothetical protein VGH88_11810 [Streptosporangiaceae bacterium]
MRLGDHAFAHYGDDNARWQVPAVFTQRGLGRGEKVLSAGCAGDRTRLVAQADGHEHVVIRCPGPHARTLRHLGAARAGRLVLDELAEDR